MFHYNIQSASEFYHYFGHIHKSNVEQTNNHKNVQDNWLPINVWIYVEGTECFSALIWCKSFSVALTELHFSELKLPTDLSVPSPHYKLFSVEQLQFRLLLSGFFYYCTISWRVDCEIWQLQQQTLFLSMCWMLMMLSLLLIPVYVFMSMCVRVCVRVRTGSALSLLYGTSATLEHHHFNHAVMILQSEVHYVPISAALQLQWRLCSCRHCVLCLCNTFSWTAGYLKKHLWP